MREIKFRAWDYYSGMNYNPTVSDGTDGGETSRVCLNSAIGDVDFVLMQYTGLKDKNGKEIYEGDIVSDIHGGDIRTITWHEKHCGFYASSSDDGHNNHMLSNANHNYIVVGNIYENKELLND